MLLNEIVLKNLSKPGRYTDDKTKGLHLWIRPDGKRYWIYRYTMHGKRQGMSLGASPEIRLQQARDRAIEARNAMNRGVNPLETRKAEKVTRSGSPVPIFKNFALEYIEVMRPKWRNPKHAEQWVNTIKSYAFPVIGERPLDQIDTPDILAILQPIWLTKPETASRLRGRLERILPCLAKPVIGKARCRKHGGLSTGPTSFAGLQAVGEATRQRMAAGQRKRALEGFYRWLDAGGREHLSNAAKTRFSQQTPNAA